MTQSNNTSDRFIVDGSSVYFPKNNSRHHILFENTYRGLNLIQARRKMKMLWAGKSLQNEMIHYLKHRKIIRDA